MNETLISKKTVVSCQLGGETLKLSIKEVGRGEISTMKR